MGTTIKISRGNVVVAVVFLLFCFGILFLFFGTSLLDFALFSVAVSVLFFIPGDLIRRTLGPMDALDGFCLSFALGLFFSSLAYYLFSMIGQRSLFFVVFLFLCLVWMWQYGASMIKEWRSTFEISSSTIWLLSLVFLSIFAVVQLNFWSGNVTDQGVSLYGFHVMDSFFFLSNIAGVKESIPLGWAELDAPYYHGFRAMYQILHPIFFALIQNSTGIHLFPLFFRFVPLLVFPMLGLLVFVTVRKLTKDEHVALWASVLTLLFSDLSVVPGIIATLLGKTTLFSQWNFFHTPLFTLPLPYTFTFFLIVAFGALYVLSVYWETKSRAALVMGTLLVGLSPLYKTLAGYAFIGGIVLAGLYSFFREKDFLGITFSFFSGLVALPLVIIVKVRGVSEGYFHFSPGYWALKVLENLQLVNADEFSGSWSAQPFLWVLVVTLAFLVFFVMSFGLRIFAFAALRNRVFLSFPLLCVLGTIIVGVVFSNLFTYSEVYPSATLHAYMVAVVFLNIFAAMGITHMLAKLDGAARIKVIGILCLVIAIPFVHATVFANKPFQRTLPLGQYHALEFIRTSTSSDSVILHSHVDVTDVQFRDGRVVDFDQRNYYHSGISQRHSVIEGESYLLNNNVDMGRLRGTQTDVKEFFSTANTTRAKEIIVFYGVDYVYVDKVSPLLFDEEEILTPVFQNGEVVVYRVVE